MTIVSKKDFIEIEYTGKLKEENVIFDTTDEKVAKENKLESRSRCYLCWRRAATERS